MIKERCIWVGSLCIVQDDTGDVKAQVYCMDKVYRAASLTSILDTSGGNADTGIEGCNLTTKAVKIGPDSTNYSRLDS